MTRLQRVVSMLVLAGLAAACGSTELSIPTSHPGNPSAKSAPLVFAAPLPGGLAGGQTARTADAGSRHDHQHAASYTCPMHPEIVRDKPGSCPLCGMKLVPKKDNP